MTLRSAFSPRLIVLVLLWAIPILFYTGLGMLALYQVGWLWMIGVSLPVMWLAAWLVGKLWKPSKLRSSNLDAATDVPDFWTQQDAQALALVDQYRREAPEVDRFSISNPERYISDAQAIARLLANHYYSNKDKHLLEPLTMVEIFTVIHLASEDLEEWILYNVPGSDLATIGHLTRLPEIVKAFDSAQTIAFFASSIFNPLKVLTYPLWRKSGLVTVEIQNEIIRTLYQRYLRQIGYYLVEMYSGRLKGGAKSYRSRFGKMAMALHSADGAITQLADTSDVSTTIAIMGQVKAGKSSLVNALIGNQAAATGILPLTKNVQRFEYPIQGSPNVVSLLDTPGYDESDASVAQVREITTAAEAADLILLVMAANVSARQADSQMLEQLARHYRDRPRLKPPVIIAVLTHIDLLRPVREWNPPYDWRNPVELKEESIANAVAYAKELFGDRISGYACVYTGTTHESDTSVVDEVVPLLVAHLGQGKISAVLKAFYKQLSSQRLQRLLKQTSGLLKHIVGKHLP